MPATAARPSTSQPLACRSAQARGRQARRNAHGGADPPDRGCGVQGSGHSAGHSRRCRRGPLRGSPHSPCCGRRSRWAQTLARGCCCHACPAAEGPPWGQGRTGHGSRGAAAPRDPGTASPAAPPAAGLPRRCRRHTRHTPPPHQNAAHVAQAHPRHRAAPAAAASGNAQGHAPKRDGCPCRCHPPADRPPPSRRWHQLPGAPRPGEACPTLLPQGRGTRRGSAGGAGPTASATALPRPVVLVPRRTPRWPSPPGSSPPPHHRPWSSPAPRELDASWARGWHSPSCSAQHGKQRAVRGSGAIHPAGALNKVSRAMISRRPHAQDSAATATRCSLLARQLDWLRDCKLAQRHHALPA